MKPTQSSYKYPSTKLKFILPFPLNTVFHFWIQTNVALKTVSEPTTSVMKEPTSFNTGLLFSKNNKDFFLFQI